MSEVKDFPIKITGDETPQRILKAAQQWEEVEDLVIVATIDGEVFVSGTQGGIQETIGLLELGKYKMMVNNSE